MRARELLAETVSFDFVSTSNEPFYPSDVVKEKIHAYTRSFSKSPIDLRFIIVFDEQKKLDHLGFNNSFTFIDNKTMNQLYRAGVDTKNIGKNEIGLCIVQKYTHKAGTINYPSNSNTAEHNLPRFDTPWMAAHDIGETVFFVGPKQQADIDWMERLTKFVSLMTQLIIKYNLVPASWFDNDMKWIREEYKTKAISKILADLMTTKFARELRKDNYDMIESGFHNNSNRYFKEELCELTAQLLITGRIKLNPVKGISAADCKNISAALEEFILFHLKSLQGKMVFHRVFEE